MSKVFMKGDYPPGTRLRCTRVYRTTEYTVGKVYLVNNSMWLESNTNAYSDTVSEFEVIDVLSKYSVELTPLSSQLRIYPKGKSYNAHDAYDAIMTIQYLTPDTVYISGAHGVFTAAIRTLISDKLREVGIKHIRYMRKDKQKEVAL